ncbi:hypothetical protein HYDPIDRAFT_40331 [Hydnomerulius pinastri MD-312]|uniref:Arrestin-like N-terminal domain-containing protein n=1 Tax=Hydnomerulius pinastri MD-312 TaxID=994086 RepID=A0A0C9WF94_9AGAM|nr:hypothetical protein HYDPIDRAFT_40331 [Hydnomerulius pinastri MD-312]
MLSAAASEPAPPPYTPCIQSPPYSALFAETPTGSPSSSAARPSGTFHRLTETISLSLDDQHSDSAEPVYGRNGVVHGRVSIKSKEALTSVSVKLKGEITVKISGNSTRVVLFSESYPLWDSKLPSGEACPPQEMAFAPFFPTNYHRSPYTFPLPPSYEDDDKTALCAYSLTISLNKPRQLFSLLTRSEKLVTKLRYHPRSRPKLPILPPELSFLATLKSCPEDWYESTAQMATRDSNYPPIDCLLFIPSTRVYALSDIITFHLQLRIPLKLCASYGPAAPDEPGMVVKTNRGQLVVRVSLLRLQQTSFRPNDQKTNRRRILAEGQLNSAIVEDCVLPSRLCPPGDYQTLDWEGQLRRADSVSTPGFVSTHLSIKDYVVLDLFPVCAGESTYLRLQHCQPVTLVTDAWSEQGSVDVAVR